MREAILMAIVLTACGGDGVGRHLVMGPIGVTALRGRVDPA